MSAPAPKSATSKSAPPRKIPEKIGKYVVIKEVGRGSTGIVYLSSMSVLLIAACYWKRANNWGAYAAIIVGAAVLALFLFLEKTWRVPVVDVATGLQKVGPDGVGITMDYLRHRIGPTAPHWTDGARKASSARFISSTCAIPPTTRPAMWLARSPPLAANWCRRPTNISARLVPASC